MAQTEVALRLTYGVILPRLKRETGAARLGFSRPAYEVAFARTMDFYDQIAPEVKDWWQNVLRDNEWSARDGQADNWKKIERRNLTDRALDLITAVGGLPAPTAQVITLRASGMNWKQICKSAPGRPLFCLKDDWTRGLQRLSQDHHPLIQQMI